MRTKYLVALVVLLALALPASHAQAGGIVTICDEAHLLAALAGGGTVTFDCSGTIILSAEIVIAADTTIDGSGQAVSISGNNAVRVFFVNEAATFTINELTIAAGNSYDGVDIYNKDPAALSNRAFSDSDTNHHDGGGGLYNDGGTVIIDNSTFSWNRASNGGGIYNGGGTVTVNNSSFSNNTAWMYIYIHEGGNGGGIINFGTLNVNDSVFNGNSGFFGGAIDNRGTLSVRNSVFSANAATFGGAIGNYNTSVLTAANCTFSRNIAWDYAYFGGGGGGIINLGSLSVNDSTFDTNIAVGGDMFASNGYGGGVFNIGTLSVSNSTFSGNRATGSEFAGGIGGGLANFGALIASNSTVSGNTAAAAGNFNPGVGGGIYNSSTLHAIPLLHPGYRAIYEDSIHLSMGMATLMNTVVANNQQGGNCAGPITDGGGNLSYPETNCPGINADPVLGPLQDNGGPTWTMALGRGSAAIDAGNDAICAAAPVNGLDQRGIVRPQGLHCDIGAVEQAPYPLLPQRLWLPAVLAQS